MKKRHPKMPLLFHLLKFKIQFVINCLLEHIFFEKERTKEKSQSRHNSCAGALNKNYSGGVFRRISLFFLLVLFFLFS